MGFYLNQTTDVSLLTTRPQLFWPLLLLLTTELMWGKLYKIQKGKTVINYIVGIDCLYSPDFIYNHLQELLGICNYHFEFLPYQILVTKKTFPYSCTSPKSLLTSLSLSLCWSHYDSLMLISEHFLLTLFHPFLYLHAALVSSMHINHLNVCHYSLNIFTAQTQTCWGWSSFCVSLTDKSLIVLSPWFVPTRW